MSDFQSPFQNLPKVVVGLATVLIGLELLFQGAETGLYGGPQAISWRLNAIQFYGFSDPVFDWMVRNRLFPTEHLVRFFTFPFLHGGFVHAVFPVVFILAIGKAISGTFSAWRVLVIYFGASIFGALVYGLILQTQVPLYGGMTGAYGLIGAFTYILWQRARRMGEPPYKAFTLIGMLTALQLLFGGLFGVGPSWLAELAGFLCGFVVAFPLGPGGWRSLKSLMRNR